MMRLLPLLLLLTLVSCRDIEVTPDEAAFNRQRCFQGKDVFCECDNPGTDAEARYCEQEGL